MPVRLAQPLAAVAVAPPHALDIMASGGPHTTPCATIRCPFRHCRSVSGATRLPTRLAMQTGVHCRIGLQRVKYTSVPSEVCLSAATPFNRVPCGVATSHHSPHPSNMDEIDSHTDLAGAAANQGAVKHNINFRKLAWASALAFLGAVGIGGVITFTATGYTKEKDVIYRYYDTFNPCIFFDHYPANVVSLVGFAVLQTIMSTSLLAQFFYTFLTSDILLILFISLGLSFVYFTQAAVVNIFTAGLYPEGSSDVDISSNGTVLALSGDTVSNVELHTSFYILWLAGHLVGMVIVLRLIHYMGTPFSRKWKLDIAFGFGFLAIMAGMCLMLVAMMERTATSSWTVDLNTWAQHALKWLSDVTMVNVWHFVPVFVYPFAFPKSEGIIVSLRPAREDHNSDKRKAVNPATLISAISIVFAVLICGSYLERNPQRKDSFQLALIAGFEQKPYNLLYTCVWMMTTHATGISIVLSSGVADINFGKDSHRARFIKYCGFGLYVSMHLGLMVVLKDFPTGVAPALFFFIFLPPWLVAVYGVHWRSLTWAGVWYLSFFLSLVDNIVVATLFNAVMVIQLCLLFLWMPVDQCECCVVEVAYANPRMTQRFHNAEQLHDDNEVFAISTTKQDAVDVEMA